MRWSTRSLLLSCLLATACRPPAPAQPAPPPLRADVEPAAIAAVARRVADWQLANPSKDTPWRWTNAAFLVGLMAFAELEPEGRYLEAVRELGERQGFRPGPRPFHADDHAISHTWLRLHRWERDPRTLAPTLALLDLLARHPFDESLLWENQIFDREWAWCDALFMSPPTLALATSLTGDSKYLALMDRLWWKTSDYLYDRQERLFYRDSRFFDRREPNGRKVFWSRGNGWVIAGLARVLEELPDNFAGRARYVAMFREMAERVAGLQGQDGYWRSSLLDPGSVPNPETSGTGFFTYALAWGVNQGLLDAARYRPVVERGWRALVRAVRPDGMLGYVQRVGYAPGATEPDKTETYGAGALLLAASELQRMAILDGTPRATVRVRNPLALARPDETVEAPWPPLARALGADAAAALIVVDGRTGRLLPAQAFDGDGDGAPDRLLWKASLAAGETRAFQVHRLARPVPLPLAARAYGRAVPERKDDFTWENDRIAYRVYGPALEATGEISSGVDVWAKRVRRPIVDAWYRGGDYHRDHGEGLDQYKVGDSRGCGGLAMLTDAGLVASRNYKTARVLAAGPLRVAVELQYAAWGPEGREVEETRRISLDVGQNLNRVEVRFTPRAGVSAPLAIGVVRRGAAGAVLKQEGARWLGYWEPPNGEDGQIGCGIVHPWRDARANADLHGHVLVSAEHPLDRPLVYHAGAAWSKGLDFARPAEWAAYLDRFARGVEAPLVVEAPAPSAGAARLR